MLECNPAGEAGMVADRQIMNTQYQVEQSKNNSSRCMKCHLPIRVGQMYYRKKGIDTPPLTIYGKAEQEKAWLHIECLR